MFAQAKNHCLSRIERDRGHAQGQFLPHAIGVAMQLLDNRVAIEAQQFEREAFSSRNLLTV